MAEITPPTDLKNFEFQEVIGSDATRKSIFILIKHISDNQSGVLICDKYPFIEESSQIASWMKKADLKFLASNDIYGNYQLFLPKDLNGIKATLIYPATEQHIIKYRRQEFFLVYETAEDYRNLTTNFIKEGKFSLSWVYNFLNKTSESERIVLEDENDSTGFLMAPDLKWNGIDIENLYLQAIVKRRDLQSVRDLRSEHISMLENIRDKCTKYVLEKYSLKKNQLLLYFHYQPTFYHLHVHIVNAKYEAPGHSSTSIFLETVIKNLKLFPDFYAKATLPFFCKETHPLYKIYQNAGRL